MIIKSRLWLLPGLDPIDVIVAIADRYTGLQFPPDLGWVVHFFTRQFLGPPVCVA